MKSSILAILSTIILFQFLIHATNGRYVRSSRSIEEDQTAPSGSESGDESEDGLGDEDLTMEEGDIDLDQEPEEEFEGPRPIMHTFYQRIDPLHHHQGTTFNKGTGMSTDKGHQDLLATWEFAWQNAGFETRVLDIKDVMKHQNYKNIRKFLDNEAFGEYDELCFLRWFAMATVGGGWMSDYDVVPLKGLVPDEYFAPPKKLSKKDMGGNNGIPVPYGGKFTIYANDGRVPCLMSGSQHEWDRLAKGLLDLTHHHTTDFYSDMYALGDYDKSLKNAFEKRNEVVSLLSEIQDVDGVIDCEKVWNSEDEQRWAIHFSHFDIGDAVERGILDENITHDDRPMVETNFLESWHEQCGEDFENEE
jgi:hypothetical protein